MKLKVVITRLHRWRLKQRLRAISYTLPFAELKIKKKPMSEKQTKSEKIKELQDTIDTHVEQLAEVVKHVGTLRKEVDDLKKSNNELRQLCSVGQ